MVHLVKHVAGTIFNRILTIEAALSLTRPGDGLVVKSEYTKTAGKWARGVDVIAEVDIREGLHELVDIIEAIVVALDVAVL